MLNLKEICRFVRHEGGVFSFPTDTLFALACDAANEDAIKRLFKAKQRPIEKTAPILVSSLQMAQEYVYFSDKELELAQEYWPGALTLVLNAMPGKVADIALRDGAIGVRVPGDRAARELIEAIGVPLIGTSANIAGGDNLLTSQEIEAQLRVQVLDTGCIPNGSCSTIVRVQEGGVLNVLRQGAVIVQPL